MNSNVREKPRFGPFGPFAKRGTVFVQIGGISGALAILMGLYGASLFHVSQMPDNEKKGFFNFQNRKDQEAKRKELMRRQGMYHTANFYHIIHTLAIIAAPLSKRPFLTVLLMTAGTSVFCGTIYHHTIT